MSLLYMNNIQQSNKTLINLCLQSIININNETPRWVEVLNSNSKYINPEKDFE